MLRIDNLTHIYPNGTRALDGVISGEHGIRSAKARFMPTEVGEVGIRAMYAVKKALDPNNILNPGKMFV